MGDAGIDIDIDALFERLGCDDHDDDDDDIDDSTPSPWLKPFDELKNQTESVSTGNIFKKILNEGYGQQKADRHNKVEWCYNMYAEYEMKPFDSTKSTTSVLAEVPTGVRSALNTMREGEEAQFVINHDQMFGKLGCPPRIKAQSNVLLVAKLIRFIDVIGDSKADEK